MHVPFYEWRIWRRVLLKALILIVIANVLYLLIQPMDKLRSYSVFGHIFPYRERLAVPDLDMRPQMISLETLFQSHVISLPKAPDEYRVVVMGDSGANGWGNADTATISAYLNSAALTLKDRKLRVYNLAHVGTSAMRDLLIGDTALDYQPDLFVWFVTLQAFQNIQSVGGLFEANEQRFTRLTARFGLDDVNAQAYGHYEDTWWQHTLLFERADIYRWLAFQTYALRQPAYKSVNQKVLQQAIPTQPVLSADDPVLTPMPNATWKALTAMSSLSSVPVLIVNEPILVVPGNTSNYDEWIGRALYDKYRTTFQGFCNENHLWCLDLWNSLPPTDYSDMPLHHTDQGNALIASLVANEIRHFLNNNQLGL